MCTETSAVFKTARTDVNALCVQRITSLLVEALTPNRHKIQIFFPFICGSKLKVGHDWDHTLSPKHRADCMLNKCCVCEDWIQWWMEGLHYAPTMSRYLMRGWVVKVRRLILSCEPYLFMVNQCEIGICTSPQFKSVNEHGIWLHCAWLFISSRGNTCSVPWRRRGALHKRSRDLIGRNRAPDFYP